MDVFIERTETNSSKVTGKGGVDDDEDVSVGELLEAEENPGREDEDEHLEVEEERWPRGWLMLRDGRNNGDSRNGRRAQSQSFGCVSLWISKEKLTVNLGVASVPKRVKPASPGSNRSAHCQRDESSESQDEDGDDEESEEHLELLGRQMRSDDLDKGNELKETEDA